MTDIDEPTTRLKMAKILQDYKDGAVDYIRTAQALEALITNERREAYKEGFAAGGVTEIMMHEKAAQAIAAQLQPNEEEL